MSSVVPCFREVNFDNGWGETTNVVHAIMLVGACLDTLFCTRETKEERFGGGACPKWFFSRENPPHVLQVRQVQLVHQNLLKRVGPWVDLETRVTKDPEPTLNPSPDFVSSCKYFKHFSSFSKDMKKICKI